MKLDFKRIGSHNLPLPKYESEESAGLDFRAACNVTLFPNKESLVPLGFAMELDPDYCLFLIPRSGLGAKKGIVLGNLIGLIDPDYRGELMAKIWYRRMDGPSFDIEEGDRICQGIIMPRIVANSINEVDELSDTSRGKGGFGHSGVK